MYAQECLHTYRSNHKYRLLNTCGHISDEEDSLPGSCTSVLLLHGELLLQSLPELPLSEQLHLQLRLLQLHLLLLSPCVVNCHFEQALHTHTEAWWVYRSRVVSGKRESGEGGKKGEWCGLFRSFKMKWQLTTLKVCHSTSLWRSRTQGQKLTATTWILSGVLPPF